ncbi:Rhodanese-like domain-containing protein 9 [Ranunculus cassubicifolius]
MGHGIRYQTRPILMIGFYVSTHTLRIRIWVGSGTFLLRTVHNGFSGLFFGIPFTKPNAEFVQSVKNQFSPDRKLLVVCQEGLRSAAAAYKLEEAGFENISCISSGLQSVKPGTFDSVGSSELQNAGKAGLVVVQGKISAVLGTVLVILLLLITVFPDQAEKILKMFPGS